MDTLKKSLALSCLALPLLAYADDTSKTDTSAAASEHAAPTSRAAQQLHEAKAAQNPITANISLPFQNSTNFNVGPDNQTQNMLLIQPVLPFKINDDWNLIQRTILPIETQPGFVTGDGTTTGLGNTQILAYFVTSKPTDSGWYFGVSPIGILPASSNSYGSKNWGYGLGGVAVAMPGKWVIGGILSQIWIPAGAGSAQVCSTDFQYFVNYNLSEGWYLSANPMNSYNKRAAPGDRWTVPLGGGVGKIVHWGKQPINLSVRGYKNVIKPSGNSADLELQFQATWLFPSGIK